MFAILREQDGFRHWVRKQSPSVELEATARRPPSADLQYAELEAAERDAEIFRQENTQLIKATKRRRNKIPPATYSVVPIDGQEGEQPSPEDAATTTTDQITEDQQITDDTISPLSDQIEDKGLPADELTANEDQQITHDAAATPESSAEHKPPPLCAPSFLEIGKRYRARNDWITGPLFETPNEFIRAQQPFAGRFDGEESGEYWTWQSDGRTWSGSMWDLTELANEQPKGNVIQFPENPGDQPEAAGP